MTEPTGLLLGVDGGNTKSIALLATPDGTIVGAGRSAGSSDMYAVGVDVAFARLDEAFEGALAAAGERLGAEEAAALPVLGAGFSLAGADWPEDIELAERRLGERWTPVRVVNDGIGALRVGIPEGPGVIVVCGTGAATGARGPDGRTWHSSFWQLPQGADELGTKAMDAVVRAELGAGPPTSLTRAIPAALGEPTVEAVLHRLTGRATKGRREHASLAPIVLDAAEDGDEVAAGIVRSHGQELGRFAAAAARRVGIDGTAFTLALAGGVVRHGGRTLPDALVGVVRESSPAVHVVQTSLEPAVGALLLAYDLAGIPTDASIEAALRASMPGAELFDTRPVVRS